MRFLTSDKIVKAELMPDQNYDVSIKTAKAASQRIDGREDTVGLGSTDRKNYEKELKNAVDEEVEGKVGVGELLPTYTRRNH
jgi:N-acetylneuraminic acid mutarotase